MMVAAKLKDRSCRRTSVLCAEKGERERVDSPSSNTLENLAEDEESVRTKSALGPNHEPDTDDSDAETDDEQGLHALCVGHDDTSQAAKDGEGCDKEERGGGVSVTRGVSFLGGIQLTDGLGRAEVGDDSGRPRGLDDDDEGVLVRVLEVERDEVEEADSAGGRNVEVLEEPSCGRNNQMSRSIVALEDDTRRNCELTRSDRLEAKPLRAVDLPEDARDDEDDTDDDHRNCIKRESVVRRRRLSVGQRVGGRTHRGRLPSSAGSGGQGERKQDESKGGGDEDESDELKIRDSTRQRAPKDN